MEIRPPNKPNYPAIAEMLGRALERPVVADQLAGQVMADQHYDPNLVWLAREKGELLGYLATVLVGENAWVKLLAVEPSYRNKGLGRQMLEKAEERLFGEGAKVMRAGFGPGPLFFPGVPEGQPSQFFQAMGYSAKAGGTLATIEEEPSEAPYVDVKAARELMEVTSALWWSEVEERFTFKRPQLAMSRDGKALCLADPGLGIGPLFFSDEGSATEAVKGALAVAGAGSRLSDFRAPAWWQERFRINQTIRCNEFQKDLRGIYHA
jgi:GNAT superfamily N-acetyltransferase